MVWGNNESLKVLVVAKNGVKEKSWFYTCYIRGTQVLLNQVHRRCTNRQRMCTFTTFTSVMPAGEHWCKFCCTRTNVILGVAGSSSNEMFRAQGVGTWQTTMCALHWSERRRKEQRSPRLARSGVSESDCRHARKAIRPRAHTALTSLCIYGSVPAVLLLGANTARNSSATVPSLLHASFRLSFFFHWLTLLRYACVTVSPEKKGE